MSRCCAGHRRRTAENSAGYLLPLSEAGNVGARRGLRPRDHHRRPRRAGRPRTGHCSRNRPTRLWIWLARRRRTRGQSNVSSRPLTCTLLTFPTTPRRRACPSGAAARGRPGAGAARDAPGVRAGRNRRGARRRLCGIHLVPAASAARPLDDLYSAAARANGGEPDAGRRLLAWARQAGFDDITPTGGMWCFATSETRDWWGGMWADRIVESALSRQLVDSGMARAAELDEISSAWRDWAAAPDGWLAIPHGEILCRGLD